MAHHVITFDPLNPRSIEHAQRSYDRVAQEFSEKVSVFLKRIADLAADTASEAFGNGVTVDVLPIENGYAITASGEAVSFLEFGAGAMTNSADMFADIVSYEVSPGSWSRTEGSGQYERDGYWYFGGVRYSYIMPRGGMQKAYEAVQTKCFEIAREVFGQ